MKKYLFSLVSAVFMLFLFTASAQAATYYVATTGSDANIGSSAAPWKTFAFAIPRLQPGDTLYLKNGTYTTLNSGLPNFTCGSNAVNGTAAQPITIKAENERQAHLSGNGSVDTLVIRNCSYWTIEGLEISNADNSLGVGYPNVGTGRGIHAYQSNNLTIRRNVLHHVNRYCNCHLIFLENSPINLIEENEFYYFHRHGINVFLSNGVILRRNYYNPRGYTAIAGGAPTNIGGEASSFYPSDNSIMENEINERSQCLEVLASPGTGSNNNSVYGSICLNGVTGINTYGYGDVEAAMSKNNRYENVVVINEGFGNGSLAARNIRGYTIKNFSAIGGAGPGIRADIANGPCCAPRSVALENVLVTGASGGLNIDTVNYSYTLNKVNVYNSGGSTPSSGFTTTNPNLGTCRVYIPDGSPMKGQGTNGADIGANILYRYQNGVLTNQPLWNPTTGEFPHGTIITGLNDLAGQSVFDVHQRLNVNTNGCLFPAGYGGGTGDTTAPTVSMTAPINGSTVSGSSVTVSANASDNVGVVGVQFLLNGANLGTEDTASPYSISWNTIGTANGSYTLTARARDAAGNTTTSTGVSVTVNNPVTSTITIGEINVLANDDSGNANLLVAQSAILSQTATIQSLSFYVTNAAGSLRLGIYDATGPSGGPGIKRAETASFTPTTGWNTRNVITPASLAPGTYWIAYLSNDNLLAFVKNSDASSSGKYYDCSSILCSPLNPLPSTFSTSPNITTSHWSFYATLNTTTSDTTPPSTPTLNAPTVISSSQINLSWSAASDPESAITSYKLYYCSGSTSCTPSTLITLGNVTSYSHTPLTANTLYRYQVSAVSSGGEGARSAIQSATTQAVASGNVYYVATTGDDARNCTTAQTITTPKRTIASGLGCLSAGSTLYVRAGTYLGIDSNSTIIPNGTSWANAPVIAAYPGEIVTLSGGSNIAAPSGQGQSEIKYIIFDGIDFQGSTALSPLVLWGNTHHIRVQNCEVFGGRSGHDGLAMSPNGSGGSADFNEIINCKIYDNIGVRAGELLQSGTVAHGLYISTNNNLFDRIEVYNNGHLGMQLYCGYPSCVPSNNIVRNSIFHENGITLTASGSGLTISGNNNTAYNNLFYSERQGGITLCCNGGATNSKVYNNTFYNNPYYAIEVQGGSNNTLKNNIFWNNGGTINDTGSGTIQSNNLTTNPLFVNAAANDFHLQATSPAINTGVTLSEVTTDFDNVSRPQGTAYDIGAYEFMSAGGDTTAPTVSMTAPTSGSTVSNTITVSANASDPVVAGQTTSGVAAVQFLLNGVNLGTEDPTSPYSISWNTTTATNGSHTVTARARDAAGNTTTSSAVTVMVSNVLVGDLNGDRTVNGLDWTIMEGQWFTSNVQSDLNSDGIVNSIDFSLMNANWGRTI